MLSTSALAALALAGSASAHIALWHPSMYGFDQGGAAAVQPLQQMNFDQWWFHGFINNPPKAGVFMELPAGGTFHGELGCNGAFTSSMNPNYKKGEDIMACNVGGGDGKGGALHSTDTFGIPASQTKGVKGCGLAIAYKSDPKSIVPEDFTVISTNDKCPWRRDVDFQIPAGLPACPEGGCHCLWGWIHASDAGTQQITGNVALPAPQVARKCPTDKSNCTVGAKQPHYWLQNERNNNFQHWTDAPFYNSDYGFSNGAQTDLWATVPKVTTTSKAPTPTTTTSSKAPVTTTTSKAPAASSSAAASDDSWMWNAFSGGQQKREAGDAEDLEARRVPPQARRAVAAIRAVEAL